MGGANLQWLYASLILRLRYPSLTLWSKAKAGNGWTQGLMFDKPMFDSQMFDSQMFDKPMFDTSNVRQVLCSTIQMFDIIKCSTVKCSTRLMFDKSNVRQSNVRHFNGNLDQYCLGQFLTKFYNYNVLSRGHAVHDACTPFDAYVCMHVCTYALNRSRIRTMHTYKEIRIKKYV